MHLSIVGLSRIDNLCGTSTLSPTTNLNNNHFYAKPLLYQYTTDRTRRYNLNTPTFTLQSPLQHRPIVENITTDTYTNISNSINYGIRRAPTLRRSDSYSPGMVLPSIAKRNVFLEVRRVCEKKQKSIFRTWISIDLITALRDTSQCTFEYSTFVDEILNEVQCPISKQSFSKINSF